MKLIHVAAAVLNQTPLDWPYNALNVRQAIQAARERRVGVLCLPELCLTGYGCEDAFHAVNTHQRAWRALEELLAETRGMVVSFGLPVLHQNGLFNCAALAVDGHLVGLVAKRFLAGDGIHYEPRWFKPWPSGVRDEFIAPNGDKVPIGDIHFEIGGIRIGFEICEDAWVANRPGAALALQGVDVILNPSASHFAFGKLEVRKRLVLEGSRAYGVSYVYANLLGNESGRAIYDGGALIASGGKLVAAGPRFSFADFQITDAVIDVDAARMNQARTSRFEPVLTGENLLCIHSKLNWPEVLPETPRAVRERNKATGAKNWETSGRMKDEEFTRAEALALFDYLRKSHSEGFVVSLSGGADSAAVSCLVSLACESALAEVGIDGLRAKLGYIKNLPVELTAHSLTNALLTTAYQATENSGKVTREAARAIAEAIGANHFELDVSELHHGYLKTMEQALGRKLDWKTDDIALQNIQARIRSPGIWMLANIRNALLLSTSNRSEAAVGYATMDGDTSGGLSPIAGIDKAFLRQWLRWMETTGPEGLHPIPALAAVNREAPTAELRPADHHQTDEDDLMPYDVLDAIERAAIRDKRSLMEAFNLLRGEYPQYDMRQFGSWIERFFRLWSRNQWKRERYAPSFHLDDENLDPKTWCRWPILSGGFETELVELRESTAKTA
ncbi:MAG TPA: NAD(+) synthase [Verrucomicrobiae bacterium]|jgi:NAD+ synthase (glutamine-hydrolysing)|nr:NAD(+) synthase [Verrucomicrobiae bacterium]